MPSHTCQKVVLLGTLVLLAACAGEPTSPTAPLFKAGGAPATPLTASPTQFGFTLPPGTPATLTARVKTCCRASATEPNPSIQSEAP